MKRRCVIVCLFASLAAGPAIGGPCAPVTDGTFSVAAVRDGRTITLTDGRELRLAGIEVAGRGAEALRRLVDGKALRLPPASTTDRYGRVVGFAALPGAGQTVQEALLAQGEALVSARIDEKACAEALFAAEKRPGPPAAACGPTPISPL